MRAYDKNNYRPETFRRFTVALQQGKGIKKVTVSATSTADAINTARVNHGGGVAQWARPAHSK
jgi:hypothetical protein